MQKSKTTHVNKEYKSIDVNDINHFIALVHNLNVLLKNMISSYIKISNYTIKNEWQSDEDHNNLMKSSREFSSECDKIYDKRAEIVDKYGDGTYIIMDSYADKFMYELSNLIKDYQKSEETLNKCADKIDSLSNEFNSKNNESSAKLYKSTSELAKSFSQSISLVNGSINIVIKIINNSIILLDES